MGNILTNSQATMQSHSLTIVNGWLARLKSSEEVIFPNSQYHDHCVLF